MLIQDAVTKYKKEHPCHGSLPIETQIGKVQEIAYGKFHLLFTILNFLTFGLFLRSDRVQIREALRENEGPAPGYDEATAAYEQACAAAGFPTRRSFVA